MRGRRKASEHEPAKAKRDRRMDREGVPSRPPEIRDGPIARKAHSVRRQALESTPTEGVSGHDGRQRVTAEFAEVALAIGESTCVRLRGRSKRAQAATETSEAKIATLSTGEKLVEKASGPAKAGSSA